MNPTRNILKNRFGFDSFREGQEESINALFEHKRILCIQPTGYGKSLIYQLPSQMVDGMTLVISPLLALVRDQIQQLENRFSIPAAAINSDQTSEENAMVMSATLAGKRDILFIAPEQLDNLDTLEFILKLKVSLLVVDEAHCISTWGHDFRPSYRQIAKAVQIFEAKNEDLLVLGLTATADHKTEQDIAAQLQSVSGVPLETIRFSMDRKNFTLSCIPLKGVEQKLEFLEKKLNHVEGSGLLYCSTREQTEIVAEYLNSKNLNVAAYHAGYSPERKKELQQALIQGKYKAIAATNALGMGIDKEDVRFVIHVDLPASITAYYQEVGRAGRDGRPAEGILLFDQADKKVQTYFIDSANPAMAEFYLCLRALEPQPDGTFSTLSDIKIKTGLHPTKVNVILAELIEQGMVEKVKIHGKQVYRVINKLEPDLSRFENQNQVRNKELEKIISYGEKEVDCLMQNLRIALGDTEAEKCGRCQLCLPPEREYSSNPEKIRQISAWLINKSFPLTEKKRSGLSEGLALFKGENRFPPFIRFMRERGQEVENIAPETLEILKEKINRFVKEHPCNSLVVLPSNTWKQRLATAHTIGRVLNIPVFNDLLFWKTTPESRQGELMNNDQRKANVHQLMSSQFPGRDFPDGAILLLDDYTGSGHTLIEAARALRKDAGLSNEIFPFTIAQIRWRLGGKGIV